MDDEHRTEIAYMLDINKEDSTIELLAEYIDQENIRPNEELEQLLHDYTHILNQDEYYEILMLIDYDDVINFCKAKDLILCSDVKFWRKYITRYGYNTKDFKDYNVFWLKRAIKIIDKSKKEFPNYINKYELI